MSVLAELAGTNGFVIPLDHQGRQFRYHPLLREVLGHLLNGEVGGGSAPRPGERGPLACR